MIEEIIKKALEFLEKGELKKCQDVLIENIHLFPEETQIDILSSIIQSNLTREIEKLEEIVSGLENVLQKSK